MSKENYKDKVKYSRLIPNAYKEKYNEDYEELKEELNQQKEELNDCINNLSKAEKIKIKAFLSAT